MITEPKSGCPVRGQIEVNSIADRVTSWTAGAGKASALSTSRAAPGFSGRGNGPVCGKCRDLAMVHYVTLRLTHAHLEPSAGRRAAFGRRRLDHHPRRSRRQTAPEDPHPAHLAYQGPDHPPGTRSGSGLRVDHELLRSFS